MSDISQGGAVQTRAQIFQQKTQRPVKFEITNATREVINDWIEAASLKPWQYLFPSRMGIRATCLLVNTHEL